MRARGRRRGLHLDLIVVGFVRELFWKPLNLHRAGEMHQPEYPAEGLERAERHCCEQEAGPCPILRGGARIEGV